MLAGVSSVDSALLVVASDDGIMPQTREHLEILSLIGIKQLTVAISKIDEVDEFRIARLNVSRRTLAIFRFTAPDFFRSAMSAVKVSLSLKPI